MQRATAPWRNAINAAVTAASRAVRASEGVCIEGAVVSGGESTRTSTATGRTRELGASVGYAHLWIDRARMVNNQWVTARQRIEPEEKYMRYPLRLSGSRCSSNCFDWN